MYYGCCCCSLDLFVLVSIFTVFFFFEHIFRLISTVNFDSIWFPKPNNSDQVCLGFSTYEISWMLQTGTFPIPKASSFLAGHNCYLRCWVYTVQCILCVLFCKSDNLWTLLNGLLWIRRCRFGSISWNWSRSIPLWASSPFELYRWLKHCLSMRSGECVHFGYVCTSALRAAFFPSSGHVFLFAISQSCLAMWKYAKVWNISISCMVCSSLSADSCSISENCIIFPHPTPPNFIKLQTVHSSK